MIINWLRIIWNQIYLYFTIFSMTPGHFLWFNFIFVKFEKFSGHFQGFLGNGGFSKEKGGVELDGTPLYY